MSLVYFDASALVKLVVDEEGTDLAVDLWSGCDAALSGRLGHVELLAAIGAARRSRRLTRAGAATAVQLADELWSAVRPVELTPEVERRAGVLAGRHDLSGADAVHLASALAVATADLVVAAWDRRLCAAALAEGLMVAPAG